MENVMFNDIQMSNGLITYAVIDRGNGEFTSMPKSEYDEQQAALSTAMVIDDPKS